MRFSRLLATTASLCALAAIVMPQDASACSFGYSNAYLFWPIPEGREGAAPVATDTQLWFNIGHLGSTWEVELLDASDQPVTFSMEMFQDAFSGSVNVSSFVMLTPDAPLEPETTYTFVGTLAVEGATEPEVVTYTFTTLDGPAPSDAPTLESPQLFVFEGEQNGDDCGFPGATRQYSARVLEPTSQEPYYYKLELEFADKDPLISEKFFGVYGSGGAIGPALIHAFTSEEEGDYPCATLTKRDVYGREVEATSSCDWSCKIFETGHYDALSTEMEDNLTDCSSEMPDPDMGEDVPDMGTDVDMSDSADPASPTEQDEEGATCSTAPSHAPAGAISLLGLLGLLFARRRRR